MKITKFILAAALLGGMTAGLTSCSDDDAPIVYYPVSLNITLPEEITDAEILSRGIYLCQCIDQSGEDIHQQIRHRAGARTV